MWNYKWLQNATKLKREDTTKTRTIADRQQPDMKVNDLQPELLRKDRPDLFLRHLTMRLKEIEDLNHGGQEVGRQNNEASMIL